MSTDDPNYSILLRRLEAVEQLLRANPLRAASVSRGTTEWRDESNLLITDSNLKVTGTAEVFGILRVVGRLLVEGLGQLVVNSLIDLLGSMRVRDGGGITVEDGGDIDVLGGAIRAGLVRIENGKVYVAGMVLDPEEHGGAVTFPNGAQVFTDADTIQLFKGNSVAQISNEYARIQHGGDVVQIDGDGVRASPGAVETVTSSDGLYWMLVDPNSGYLKKMNPSFGGPGGGAFEWPFPTTVITYGFRPPDRPTHDGIDFAFPGIGGDPIRAAAAGVVAFAGWSDGYGWYVDVDHTSVDGQTVMTRYGHMQASPEVSTGDSVARLGVLGFVGDTGQSEGDHLHWELHLNGEPVDPEPWMAAHGA